MRFYVDLRQVKLIAIDPGTKRVGYALLVVENKVKLKDSGVIHLDKGTIGERLNAIHKELNKMFTSFRPDELAIERPFFKFNANTLARISEAIGVVFQLAGRYKAQIYEYPPATVKKSVAGRGDASKSQVALMVKAILSLYRDWEEDEADAIAIGLCHIGSVVNGTPLKEKKWATS